MSDTHNRGRAEAHRYPQVVRFVRETPWSILEQTLREITEMVALHAAGYELTADEIQARIGSGPPRRDAYTTSGSVAVIPVYGVITPRADLMTDISGGTSIDRLQQSLRSAVSDPQVRSIVLDVNSPGGSVAMLSEMASEIRAARRRKPVVAVANTMAGSAAYQLASQASEVVVTPSGSVGSIGTIAAHDDISGMLEQQGIKTTVVTAGKFKGELSPFAPLSEEAKAHIQETVDSYYAMFVQDVARGRGVSVDTVRSDFGQGRMLLAKDALAAGMVDAVGTFDATVARMAKAQSNGGGTSSFAFPGVANTSGNFTVESFLCVFDGPLAPHSTATSDAAWDGAANKARLRNDGTESYYRSAFAWQDDSADPTTKVAYKFIHHEVDESGDVHAANLTACSQGIGVLNGGRSGTTIPDSDRQGVWNHLARHLRDAGREPPPLRSLADTEDFEAAASGLSFADADAASLTETLLDNMGVGLFVSFADEAGDLVQAAGHLVERTGSLAEYRDRGRLTAAKREQVAACRDALRESTHALEAVLADTDPDKHRDQAAGEFARFLARATQGVAL